jgi:uncharacterized protein YbjT (DUF2867 family)
LEAALVTAPPASFLATRRGRLTLLLLGGRAGDLLGRRRLLVAGTVVFAACSLAGGLAVSAGMLVGARLGQGAGAALMAPADLSILTTTFSSGDDRRRALGTWGPVSGLAAAAGVFLGGVLSQRPGWRWVLFVNLPVCALILIGAARLLPAEPHPVWPAGLDVPGAVLSTGGMLLLVYALVQAPDQGWGSARTIGNLPPRPSSWPVSRSPSRAAADATQMIAFAAFVSVLFSSPSTCRTSWATPDPGRRGLPPIHRRHRGRRWDLLAVPRPGPRHLLRQPAARPGDHGSRAGRRPGRRAHQGLPARPARLRRLPAGRRSHHTAGRQYAAASPRPALTVPFPPPAMFPPRNWPTNAHPATDRRTRAMNITVFGASGGIGSHVVALAAQRGHNVRAVYRATPPAPPPSQAHVLIAADILDPAFAAEAVQGTDVVVATAGPNFATHHNPRTAMTSPPDLHQRLARALVTAIRDSAPRARLICVSTASMGPADNVMGPGPRLLFRFFRTVAVPNLGRVGKDLHAMEDELAASGLDWYALRPVKLTDGPLTGSVRASDRFTMKPVSRADVAWHILALAEDPEPGPLRTPVITASSRHPRSTTGTGSTTRPAGTRG